MARNTDGWEALLKRAGHAVYACDAAYSGGKDWEVLPYEIRLKLPVLEGEDFLFIIKAHGEEGKIVAFHGGTSFAEAFTGMVGKLADGTLKWRADKPYSDVA